MSDFLTVLRAKLQAKIDERAAAKAEVDAILATPATEGRADLTPEETAKFTEARAKVKALDNELDKDNPDSIAFRVADLEAMEARRHEAIAKSPAQAAHVKSEARTYNKQSDPDGAAFLLDVARASVHGGGDWEAQQRLSRHMQEERVERGARIEDRAAGTSAFAGLVVPQYLTDMVAPAVAGGRPFADICNKRGAPYNSVAVKLKFEAGEATPKLVFQPIGFLPEAEYRTVLDVAESDVVGQILGTGGGKPIEKPAAKKPELPAAAAPAEEEEAPAPKPAKAAAAKPAQKPEPEASDDDLLGELDNLLGNSDD